MLAVLRVSPDNLENNTITSILPTCSGRRRISAKLAGPGHPRILLRRLIFYAAGYPNQGSGESAASGGAASEVEGPARGWLDNAVSAPF